MIETAEADTGVVRVVLNRPTARNALTPAGLEDLASTIEAADEREAVAVVALQGAGEAFCAGADLDAVAELDRETGADFARLGQRVARTIEDCETPVVAAIDGPAMGGGLELALACDLRVATPRSTFGEPGVTFGLFGAWGGTVRLPRIVGDGNAMDLALSGRTIDAETARRMGLVSRIVDDPMAVATTLAENPLETMAILADRIRDRDTLSTQEQREAVAFGESVERHRDDVRALRE
ncbi:enoyl-CoA hydratase/carnithine racemase [Halovivax ruber XH-70]|uniref:Enoyl-CoA hydratase/carnithine racemase n=1 Tax=Halovivax ruber (strain DSM 18193 / JCM 13892 / XH-70) TaxID=797302 RepID=L0I8W8_HALRX|nr:enoyl-CoA hydratase/isomerase family protein [Halovivax ruber]AGB15154.1 enoyl-CoA hydratase/carnithine racemase [Halovivax ruber XH-70]